MIRSTVALTYELDDLQLAAKELAEQTRERLAFRENTFGLLICDSEVDHDAFAREIRQRLHVPIVGFSSTAGFTREEGLTDMSASLTTVTSDDMRFAVAVSDPLTSDNVVEQIDRTYRAAVDSLEGEPVAVLAFAPYILGIMLDIYPRELSRVSGDLPVFGGIPAHDEIHGRTAVYCGDSVAQDRLTLLVLSGNVRPVFTVKNNLSTLVDLKRTVTRAKDNTVYTVGDETFVRFLERFGLDVEKIADATDKTTSFTAYPLLIESNDADSDGVPIVRTIHCVDMKTGSGTAIGEIPQGSTLSLGALKAADIELSARNSIEDLLAKIRANEADGYKYSTIFAISCVGRYFVMASKNTLETEVLLEGLPADLSLSGFYSFGEICPTSIRDGKARNAAHNESLVMLAF